jgi:hypothetical protein
LFAIGTNRERKTELPGGLTELRERRDQQVPGFAKLSSSRRGFCALAQFALHVDFSAMQVYATLYDHQTEVGAWTIIDVSACLGRHPPL